MKNIIIMFFNFVLFRFLTNGLSWKFMKVSAVEYLEDFAYSDFLFRLFCMMQYLELQLLSFLFQKNKSRMTIDHEDEIYRPVQQMDPSQMENIF